MPVLLCIDYSTAQDNKYECLKIKQITKIIKQYHVEPDSIDQIFTGQVNTTFINSIDPFGQYLTISDVEEIKRYCPDLPELDCESQKMNFDKVCKKLENSFLRTDSLIKAILNNTIDFGLNDSIILNNPPHPIYLSNLEDMQMFWQKLLKFKILSYYFSGYRADDTALIRNKENFIKSLDTIKSYIIQREECRISHKLDHPSGFSTYIFNLYLKSLAENFDPHTTFFSYTDKELFMSSLSKSKYSFGADLSINENGEIFINRIIPGGPAWRSKELEERDILLKIQFPNNEAIDLRCFDLMEIEEILYKSKSNKIVITAISSLGKIKTTSLNLEFIESYDNLIQSFILDGETKIGYIFLPDFYLDPDAGSTGCTSDLVRNIIKLQQDNIQGLIIDLRNNGGGSVIEAIDLTGVFIDSGPLFISKERNSKPIVIKDLNRGTVYDGPLLILVNGASASASELFSAALQDYDRAIIAGSPTFGKATSQNIVTMENAVHTSWKVTGNSSLQDFVKVTISKFYRLDGSSYQGKGVIPDIQLPDLFFFSKINESSYQAAIQNDSIVKDVSYNPFPALTLDKLQIASKERIGNSNAFRSFDTLNNQIKSHFDGQVTFPIEFGAYQQNYRQSFSGIISLDSIKAKADVFYTIRNTTFDLDILNNDNYRKEINEEFIKNLKDDFHLEEAYFILRDLINYQENQN